MTETTPTLDEQIATMRGQRDLCLEVAKACGLSAADARARIPYWEAWLASLERLKARESSGAKMAEAMASLIASVNRNAPPVLALAIITDAMPMPRETETE